MTGISRTSSYASAQPQKMRPVAPKQTPAAPQPARQPSQSMSMLQPNAGAKINYLA